MPKKFATENSKSVSAKDRKKQTKNETASKSQKEIEDAYWKDDDKQLQKKQKKKEVEEKKKLEAMQRKTEAKAILDKEMNETPKKASKPAPKVTRAQINDKIVATPKEEKHIETHLDAPLFENTNRLEIEGEEARTVDDAISILNNNKDGADKHPEKRMKAAFAAYQQRRLRELKTENTGLRLTQLKQIISKEWEKSPENPSNQ